MNYKYVKFLIKKERILEDFRDTLVNKIIQQVKDAGVYIQRVSVSFDIEYDTASIYFEPDYVDYFEIEVPATDLFPINETVIERIVNELSYEKNKEI